MQRGLNHVSVIVDDLEESLRFYVDELGLTPVPTPDFGFPVIWLQAGEQQVHLFDRPGDAPSHAHFALEIDDFMQVYLRMIRLTLEDPSSSDFTIFYFTARMVADGLPM